MSRPILVQLASSFRWQFIRCNPESVLGNFVERGGTHYDLGVQQRQNLPAASPVCSFGRLVALSHDATKDMPLESAGQVSDTIDVVHVLMQEGRGTETAMNCWSRSHKHFRG